jgi:hypothetical protein
MPVLVALLILLALATSAHAECAWMLWNGGYGSDGGNVGTGKMSSIRGARACAR